MDRCFRLMAIQTQQATIMIKRPPVYVKEEKIERWVEIHDELEKIKKVTNDYYGQLYRAIKSLENVINAAMDRRGDILPQISHQDVQVDAIRAENLEPAMKPFATTLMFFTATHPVWGVGTVLAWNKHGQVGGAPPPYTAGELYYGDWNTGVYGDCLIAGGWTGPLSGLVANGTYVYFDPRSAPTYPPATYTLQVSTGFAGAIQAFRDGHIVLCVAWRTHSNAGPLVWVNADNSLPIWGGGLHIVGS